MNDMTSVIVAKSDQINADDLLGRDMTITIEDVIIKGGQEQPVSIVFAGSDKVFRPCKSMSRVLVNVWGPDAKQYIGRSMTLYRDPSVKWGGMEVGGIRISHMSDIDSNVTMALTMTKANRKPFTVKPLKVERKPEPTAIDIYAKEFGAALKTPDAVKWWDDSTERRDALKIPQDRLDKMKAALDAKSKPTRDAE